MLSPDLHQRIVDELSRHGDRDSLIMEICDLTKRDWEQAEALVEQVRAENESVIARRRFPLQFALALVTFLGGLALTGYGSYSIALAFTGESAVPDDLTTFFMRVIEEGVPLQQAMSPAVPLYMRMVILFVFSPFSAIILGIAMILGSLLGMRDVWSAILNRGRA